jgi:hypothetical protein
MKTERETFQLLNARRTGIVWTVAVLAVASVIAVAWVGFPFVTKHDGLPKPLPAAQAQPDRLGVRLSSAEEKLEAWPKERAGLMDRMSQIEKSLSAGIRRARTEALALVEGVKRDMGQSLSTIQTRLAGVESTQVETHDEMARLQNELATVQRDLEAVREINALQASKVRQIEEAQQSTQNEVSGLQNGMLSNQEAVTALSYQVERRRVDFEVSKDRTDEVVSGIYLTINRTDVARQQVDGWLQIAGDGRFLWLHDAGAQHPVAFSSRGDERAYQLVFTQVEDGSAAGYLLVPALPANTETAAK